MFMDHKTLEIFNTQKDLSQRQARWMEFLSQYDAHFVYVQGDRNLVADALSCCPANKALLTSLEAEQRAQQPYSTFFTDDNNPTDMFLPEDERIFVFVGVLSDINPVPHKSLTLSISADKKFLSLLLKCYQEDTWTHTLTSATWTNLEQCYGVPHFTGIYKDYELAHSIRLTTGENSEIQIQKIWTILECLRANVCVLSNYLQGMLLLKSNP
jgi:hypothetical protein